MATVHGKVTLVGVTSFGIGCAEAPFPGVNFIKNFHAFFSYKSHCGSQYLSHNYDFCFQFEVTPCQLKRTKRFKLPYFFGVHLNINFHRLRNTGLGKYGSVSGGGNR